MALDWTTMVNHVVIAGRPADVEDAALGWQELIGNVRDVCTSLEQDIKGIDAFWTGKAADAFGERVKTVSQELKKVSDSAAPEGGAGIVDTLRNAAQDLQAAQAAMPVPASMLGELMAARDSRITLAPGVLEVELESGFFDNAPMSFAGWLGDQFRKVLTDVEEDARQAYDTVSQQHETAADRAPAGTPPLLDSTTPKIDTPDLSGGGPGGGGGGMPSIGGAGGGGAGGFDVPKGGGSGVGNMPGLLDGSPIAKPTSPDLGGFEPGSGLAGAGGGLATGSPPGLGGLGGSGLGAGGLGAGGLGGGAGLGSGGAGIGVPGGLGKVPGGGSLGKPITPTIAPMGGGLAGKGGGGSTRGAGGRLGAGGMAGVGGVGAGGGAAGRGTGAARGGGGMAGVGGVGAGAGGAGKGGGGKGAGGRGGGFLGGPGASGSGHGDEDEYDSWLHEDENVWNEGTDVPPPPVLGN